MQPGTEMITELVVRRALLAPFLALLVGELRARRADLIYGTARLVKRDDEPFLPWAREDQACVALRFGGTYYLTYHRYAAIRRLPPVTG